MIPTSLHVLAILALVLSASADAQQANGVRRQYAGDDLPIELKFVSFLDFAAPDDRPDDHVALEHVADAVGIRYVVNGRIDDERLQRIRVVSIYLQGVRAEIREERRQLEAEILCSGNRDQTAEQIAGSVNGVDDVKEGIARKYFHKTLRYLERHERESFEHYLDDYDTGVHTVIDARTGLDERYGDLPREERDQAVRAALSEYCTRLATSGHVTQ